MVGLAGRWVRRSAGWCLFSSWQNNHNQLLCLKGTNDEAYIQQRQVVVVEVLVVGVVLIIIIVSVVVVAILK